jgi:hypothetical protein
MTACVANAIDKDGYLAQALHEGTFSRNTRIQIKQLFDAIRDLMTPPEPPKRPIGFVAPQGQEREGPGKKQDLTPVTTGAVGPRNGVEPLYAAGSFRLALSLR